MHLSYLLGSLHATLLTAARVLSRHRSDPGGQVPPGAEGTRVRYQSDQGAREYGPTPGIPSGRRPTSVARAFAPIWQ